MTATAAATGPEAVGFGRGVRALHWLTVVLLAAAFGLAWSFNSMAPGDTAGRLVIIHRSVGLTILGLTILRLAWRSLHRLPSHARDPRWERWLANSVQALLYLGLFAQPLVGWAASGAEGDSVSYLGVWTLPDLVDPDPDRADALFALHKMLGFALLGLIGLHVAGALRHGWKRDGVLWRMVSGQPLPMSVE